jgi:hypothetical protein
LGLVKEYLHQEFEVQNTRLIKEDNGNDILRTQGAARALEKLEKEIDDIVTPRTQKKPTHTPGQFE